MLHCIWYFKFNVEFARKKILNNRLYAGIGNGRSTGWGIRGALQSIRSMKAGCKQTVNYLLETSKRVLRLPKPLVALGAIPPPLTSVLLRPAAQGWVLRRVSRPKFGRQEGLTIRGCSTSLVVCQLWKNMKSLPSKTWANFRPKV